MKIEVPLRGKRIAVRNYEPSDLNLMKDMWLDEENGAYLSDPTVAFVDDAYLRALDEMSGSPDGYYFTITLLDTGEGIGSFCAFPDALRETYDIGYCIHRRFWRLGYGREALGIVLSWLRQQGAARVTAEVADENAASVALLTGADFLAEKKTEFKKYHMNVRFDSHIYTKTF